MIKFRTKFNHIEAHEVLRETEQMVILAPNCSANSLSREVREGKRGQWKNWHDTWEDAHVFLLQQVLNEVDSLSYQLQKAKEQLGKIKTMKPPARSTIPNVPNNKRVV